jgi:uncharacterized protein YqgC (DUF456 family)
MTVIIVWVLFAVLVCFSILGCFVSKFPGPILTLIGVLLVKFFTDSPIEWGAIAVCALIVVLSIILNKILPKLVKKLATYGKGGTWGTIIGSIFTLFIVWAMVYAELDETVFLSTAAALFLILPFIFATVFELISKKDFKLAAMSGLAATVTFVCSTLVKLLAVIYSLYAIFTVSL